MYTNLMAQRNLNAAADAAERYPDHACQLGLSWQEIHGWPAAARPMLVPYDEKLAVHPQAAALTPEQKERNFAYYERITVRDSSLSACSQAVMAAETSHLRLAYDCLGEAAMIDLDDLQHDTRDGLHLASLAGSWIALVVGFGGMRRRQGCCDSRRGCRPH